MSNRGIWEQAAIFYGFMLLLYLGFFAWIVYWLWKWLGPLGVCI